MKSGGHDDEKRCKVVVPPDGILAAMVEQARSHVRLQAARRLGERDRRLNRHRSLDGEDPQIAAFWREGWALERANWNTTLVSE